MLRGGVGLGTATPLLDLALSAILFLNTINISAHFRSTRLGASAGGMLAGVVTGEGVAAFD